MEAGEEMSYMGVNKQWLAEHDRQAREELQPFVDLVKLIETKNREMVDLMRRNGMKIDNLNDPMQKLAFTFYSEIGEMSHKADVVIKEYEEHRQQAGGPR